MSPAEQPKPRRRRIAGESAAKPGAARPRPVPRPAHPGARRPSEQPRPGEASRPPRPSRLRAAGLPWRAVLAVVVLLAGIALVASGLWQLRGGGEAGLEAANRQASRAAGEAAETIFTFSHDSLDEHEKNSKALMTSDFQPEFDEVAPGLREIAPQREFEVEAQVQDAAAVPCGGDCSLERVEVLLFVDQVRLIAGSGEDPVVLGNRVLMTMVRSQGTWLVDDIRAL